MKMSSTVIAATFVAAQARSLRIATAMARCNRFEGAMSLCTAGCATQRIEDGRLAEPLLSYVARGGEVLLAVD